MGAPYKKYYDKYAMGYSDGWRIEEDGGNTIAILETETLADAILYVLIDLPTTVTIPSYQEDTPIGKNEREQT